MNTTQQATRPQSLAVMERQELVNLMKGQPVGSIFTHEQLSTHIKADHKRLMWAVRRLLLDHGTVVESIRGMGYKVASAKEVISQGAQYVQTLQNVTRLRKKKLATVEPDKLALPERTEYFQEVSRTALLHTVLSDDVMKRLPSAMPAAKSNAAQEVTPQQMVRAFAGLKF